MAEIKDYNKEKARTWFVLLKIIELFSAFLFTIGIYGLGCLGKTFNSFFEAIFWEVNTNTIFGLWLTGLGIIVTTICYLALLFMAGFIIYKGIEGFIWVNWKWARLIAETPQGKKKRLEEKRKEKLADDEEDRKEWGFCVGDEVEIKKCKVGKKYKCGGGTKFVEEMEEYIGYDAEITNIDNDGDFEIDVDDGDYDWDKDMLKLKKKKER